MLRITYKLLCKTYVRIYGMAYSISIIDGIHIETCSWTITGWNSAFVSFHFSNGVAPGVEGERKNGNGSSISPTRNVGWHREFQVWGYFRFPRLCTLLAYREHWWCVFLFEYILCSFYWKVKVCFCIGVLLCVWKNEESESEWVVVVVVCFSHWLNFGGMKDEEVYISNIVHIHCLCSSISTHCAFIRWVIISV